MTNPQWFLLLSGGAWKGAVQLPLIDHLLAQMGLPDEIRGTSVGSINGAVTACGRHKELWKLWGAIDDPHPMNGIKDFLKVTPFDKDGFWTMEPLRDLLKRYTITPAGLKTRFGCGIWLPENDEHVVPTWTAAGPDGHDITLADGILASSAICGMFAGVKVRWKDKLHIGGDGGHEHVLPPSPSSVKAGDIIDAVFCHPVEPGIISRPRRSVDGRIERLLLAADKATHAPARGDLETLKALAASGVKVRAWAPREDVGGMLDAGKEDITRRFEIGERMVRSGPVWTNMQSIAERS